MNSRDILKTQIDRLPDIVIERLCDYVAYQMYSLGVFEDDTDYLNSVPGMAEIVTQGLNTPVRECFEDLE
jgi:hypothetical protein